MDVQERIMPNEGKVLNKPWGQTLDPKLWYILQLQPEVKGVGLLMAAGVRVSGERTHDQPLCFGDELTAAVFLQCAHSGNQYVRPMQGHDIMEFWLMAMLADEEGKK